MHTTARRAIAVPRPGRPRGLEDDWASEQVDLLGRDGREVYGEWLAIMPDERRAKLKDPYNSFKNALYLRRQRRNAGPHPRLATELVGQIGQKP